MNLHVHIDIDCKNSKYSVVASSNSVKIVQILVKICLLVQKFKYGQANLTWRSEKKNRFNEGECDNIVGLCCAGSIHTGNHQL